MDLSAGRTQLCRPRTEAEGSRPVVAFSPHPLLLAKERELVGAVFLPGETIAEYLVRTGIAARMGRQPFRLKLDGRQIPRALWARCRPKPGTLIELYAVVRGGDGKKNPIATIAMIALIYYTGGASSGGAAGGSLGAAAATAAGVGTAAGWGLGILVVGGMVINSVFPPPRPDLAKAQNLGGGDSPTYAIEGGSNRMRRYEPMPKIMGVHRVFPDFGAQPYNEFHGADQVGFYVFDLGYNDAELSDFKIGDTPIGEYSGVEYEISGADGKLALVPGNVDSQAGVELPFALGFASRTSTPQARSLAVEITGSLFYFGDSGTEQRAATIDIEYRPVGGGAWSALTFASDTVPASSIVNGVARVPAADYTRGVRKAITAQPAGMPAITVLSASSNTPAGAGQLVFTYRGDSTDVKLAWAPPGGNRGLFVQLRGGGQFLLKDLTGAMDLLIQVDPAISVSTQTETVGSATVGAAEIAGQFMLLNASREPLRRTFFWHVAEGQHEVRVKKSTIDETNQRAAAVIVWSQLRTYQPDAADYTGRLRVGLKIPASALASGVLQQLSCVARGKTTVFGGGYGLDFESTVAPSQAVVLPDVPLWDFGAVDFAFECWGKAESFTSVNTLYEHGLYTAGFLIRQESSNQLRLFVNGAGAGTIGEWVCEPTIGQPYHLIVQRRGTNAEAYMNGQLLARTANLSSASAITITVQPAIGRSNHIGDQRYDGVLDGVRLYSGRSFTAAEAADHYRGRYDDETGLVGRWEFDEGMGITANDTSGNGNHGTLVNGPAWVAGDPAVPRGNVVTSNPAFWHLDALRGKTIAGRRVWGAGLADARIDIEGLKTFAAWCDAQGLTFNGVFDQQLSVHDMLSAIALMGRGTPTMQTGKHGVLWDAPDQPVTAVFGMHNIVAGSFSIDYATGDLADVVEGSFVNPDLNWQRDFVRATVPGATSEARVRRVELFGCTNKAQAGQQTNLYAAANYYRPRRYKWRSDWEQMSCPRGDVAQIGHDLLQLLSGRFVEGGSATVLKLPRKVPLYAGGAFITIRKPDATFATYAIDAGAGESDTLTPTAPLPFNPWADADGYPPYDYRWHYGPASDTGRKVKIESFKPVSLRHVDVTAVDEDPAYYTAKDNPLAVIAPPRIFGAVQLQSLNITEDGVRAGNGYMARVYVTLDVLGDYAFCDLRTSVNGGPLAERVRNQRGRTVFFDVSDFSDVVVEVTAYSSFGRTGKSSKLTAEHHVDYAGQSKPSDVRNLSLDGNTFRWTEAPEVDVTGYIIRFHYGENLSPTDAAPLHEGELSASPATFPVLPSQVVTFFLTAIDAAGLESANPATIVKNLGDPELENVVVELDFRAASWPGTVTLGSNVGGDLVANDTTVFYGPDSAPFYAASADPFYEVSVFETMVYETLGFSFPVEWIDSAMVLQHLIEGEGIAIEYRSGNDAAFYGTGAEAFYGTGGDAFYGDPGEYVRFTGTVSFAQGEYQLRLTTNGGPVQGAIRALSVVIDVPDVREVINDLAVPGGGVRLALTKPFKSIKNIQLTLEQDGGAAVSARYVDKDLTLGPLIQAIDSTGASVAGRMDAHVTGY